MAVAAPRHSGGTVQPATPGSDKEAGGSAIRRGLGAAIQCGGRDDERDACCMANLSGGAELRNA